MPLGRLFSLGFLFILWVNTHPSFFLGPLILVIFLVWKVGTKVLSERVFPLRESLMIGIPIFALQISKTCWKLPQMKVLSDGRMPAWKDENGKSPYQVYLEIVQTPPGWNEQLKKHGTNYLLINNGTFLDLLLQEKGAPNFGWQEDYRDQLAVIYRGID